MVLHLNTLKRETRTVNSKPPAGNKVFSVQAAMFPWAFRSLSVYYPKFVSIPSNLGNKLSKQMTC